VVAVSNKGGDEEKGMDFVHKTDIGYLIVDQAKSKEDSQRSRIGVGTWIAFLTGRAQGSSRNGTPPDFPSGRIMPYLYQYSTSEPGFSLPPVIQTASSFLIIGTPTQGTLES